MGSVKGKYSLRKTWPPSRSLSIVDSPGNAAVSACTAARLVVRHAPSSVLLTADYCCETGLRSCPEALVALSWPICDSPVLGLQKSGRER